MWRYSISSLVSSLSTALSISIIKRPVARILGDSLSWLTAAQDRIDSCAKERRFGLLIRVLWASALGWYGLLAPAIISDLLGGFTLGDCDGGVGAGGSTLGASTLGSTLGGIIGSGCICG